MAIALRYAARSDVGLVRQNNQDSGYAGSHLLVVADGMGGHAGGDVASSLAIGELAPLDDESHGPDALEHLSKAVSAAHRELLGRVGEEPQLAGMGTTVTALLRAGNKLALAHIGDSRAYLLRDGVLVQITRDHTFVQTLVDEGRLTPEEAEQHPQRSVLMRVLSDVVDDVEPDLSMREARVGDRYLLCSDGLSGVVSFETLRESLSAGEDPASTCESLVQLALRGGAPDNVTCIVADIIEAMELGDDAPAVVGAASRQRQLPRPAASPGDSAAERAAALTVPPPPVEDLPVPPVRAPRRLWRRMVAAFTVVALVAGGTFATWQWLQHQYFVGNQSGHVAVFRGLPDRVGPVRLSWVDQVATDIPVQDLPAFMRDRLQEGMPASSRPDADVKVQSLRDQAAACRAQAEAEAAAPSPTASPSVTSSGAAPSPTVTDDDDDVVAPVSAPTTAPTAQNGPTSTLGGAALAVNPNAGGAVESPIPTNPANAEDCGGLPQ